MNTPSNPDSHALKPCFDPARSVGSLRKDEHLELAAGEHAVFSHTRTMFNEVQLVHNCLPELSVDEIDTSTTMLSKHLRIPIIIAAMTGGSERAGAVNRQLAWAAQRSGCGLGLGSQRRMLETPMLLDSYNVRNEAPDILLLGNIGVVQAGQLSNEQVMQAVRNVGADGLCVHLNPAQELVQPEGDRDFRGCIQTLRRLSEQRDLSVIAKETGCGISYRAAKALYQAGIRDVDVSGAGGTSWVAVEEQRAQGKQRAVGTMLKNWGIPTAVSVTCCRKASMETIIATGGIRSGLDIAKALALGATAVGIARPVLLALGSGGKQGVLEYLEQLEAELRAVMLLVGAATISELRSAPSVISPTFQSWVEQLTES